MSEATTNESADGMDASAPTSADQAAPPRQRYRLTLGYEGTHFHGWQKQVTPEGMVLRTVCGEAEATLARVLHQSIELVGASRTDAGVHARGQVAHFDAATPIPVERMVRAVNSRLPEDILLTDAAIVAPSFDAIRDAVCKQYRYRIWHDTLRPLEQRHIVYHCWHRLDPARMQEAAERLIGTHDFVGFAQINHGRATTVRTILDCRVETAGREVHIVVVGTGFLYNMVRIIAGTLVEVGRGRFEPDVIDQVLASGDRAQAGPTLLPNGLWLEWIRYDTATATPPASFVNDPRP